MLERVEMEEVKKREKMTHTHIVTRETNTTRAWISTCKVCGLRMVQFRGIRNGDWAGLPPPR